MRHITNHSWVALVLLTLLTATSCHQAAKDSSATEAADKIIEASDAKDFTRILLLADSLREARKISPGESHYWQGYAYYRMGKRELAKSCWQDAIKVTENSLDANDQVYYAKSASYLTSMLCRYAEYAAALYTALPVINRLEKVHCDTTSDFTNLLVFVGCCKIYFDKQDTTATDMLERAYRLHTDNIRKNTSETAYREAMAGMINIAYIWNYVEGYKEGLLWTERMGELIKEYKSLYDTDTKYIDKQWARYKIFLATSLEGMGRHDEAERAYEEYRQTQFSETKEGWTDAGEFLTVAKRWDEVVYSYTTVLDYLEKELTVYSLDNIQRYLLKKYRAHQMLDQEDRINQTARLICEVLDSAITNNRHLDASELQSIHERDMEIVQAEKRSSHQRQLYTGLLVGVLIVAFAIYIVFRRRADKKLRKAHDALQVAYDQLEETTTVKERMESELRIARNIQMSMVPSTFPVHPRLDMYASMVPAREVGGDLYGYQLTGERLYFVLGDVSGKGVPASLFMAQATRLFQTLAKQGMTPAEICMRINDALSGADNESSMFVTMFLGLLDLQTGRLSFCNAGHNPPVLGGGDHGGDFISMCPNAPVGVIPGMEFQEEEIESIVDRPLFVYTDGLNEAENTLQEQFGDERLLSFLRSHSYDSAQHVIETIAADVERHRDGAEPNDDLTMMCLCVKHAG